MVMSHLSPWSSSACAAVIAQRSQFSRLYQQSKTFESKVKFKQASNCSKSVLEAAKLPHAHKTKECLTYQKICFWNFWRIANNILKKGESAFPPLFNFPEMLCSASDTAKLFAKNFSKNSNLDNSVICLPVFPSRTNLKLSSKLFKISIRCKKYNPF